MLSLHKHWLYVLICSVLILNAFFLLQRTACVDNVTAPVRPPTLVVYVFTETSDLKKSNLQYFLQNGYCESCNNVDYAIVVNGDTQVQFKNHTNLLVLFRPNECDDFGAWEYLFKRMGPHWYKKYKRFMFINDTVRGPYVDPNYKALFQDFHFSDLFGRFLTNHTRMVGSYINCGGFWTTDGPGYSHVQTMSFMIDHIAMEILLPMFRCYSDRNAAILEGEIGMSVKMLDSNINIASLMYAYRGVDFRSNETMRLTCNRKKNPTIDGNYFDRNVNPMEVVFYKNTMQGDMVIPDLYMEWTGGAPKSLV